MNNTGSTNYTPVGRARASQNKLRVAEAASDAGWSTAGADARGGVEMFAKHRHRPSTMLTIYGERYVVNLSRIDGTLSWMALLNPDNTLTGTD